MMKTERERSYRLKPSDPATRLKSHLRVMNWLVARDSILAALRTLRPPSSFVTFAIASTAGGFAPGFVIFTVPSDDPRARGQRMAEIDHDACTALSRHPADDAATMTFGELVERYLANEAQADPLSAGKLARSTLLMTEVLRRVWAHYLIAAMVKATLDESRAYLKEIRTEQRRRGHDWAPRTWYRYRGRASAVFAWAERYRFVPKRSNPFTNARCNRCVVFERRYL